MLRCDTKRRALRGVHSSPDITGREPKPVAAAAIHSRLDPPKDPYEQVTVGPCCLTAEERSVNQNLR